MNLFEYYTQHVFPTGWQTVASAFRIWKDLMTGNYAGYALLDIDDPYEECYAWFWATLGEDDILPKEFLEYLYQLADDIDSGKEKVYPLDLDELNRISDLLNDVGLNDE
jgi:hypothetical protein